MKKYVFAYGSLLNPKSLSKTLPGKRAAKWTKLLGYQRKINAPVGGYLYLNAVPRKEKSIPGKIILITENELEALKLRESGYACVDVTDNLEATVDGIVYSFLAPNEAYPDLKIPRSYLSTCLVGKTKSERRAWLEETLIENEVFEDLANPVYINAVVD